MPQVIECVLLRKQITLEKIEVEIEQELKGNYSISYCIVKKIDGNPFTFVSGMNLDRDIFVRSEERGASIKEIQFFIREVFPTLPLPIRNVIIIELNRFLGLTHYIPDLY